MKLKTISEADMADLIRRSINGITGNPWIATESDVKCELYSNLYQLLHNRLDDLRTCGWRVATEYNLFEDCWIDIAILRNEIPVFLLELKHLRNVSESYVREAVMDFEKRKQYLQLNPNVYFVQVITSIYNGQHKALVESRLVPLYQEAGLQVQTLDRPAATTFYIHVPSPK